LENLLMKQNALNFGARFAAVHNGI